MYNACSFLFYEVFSQGLSFLVWAASENWHDNKFICDDRPHFRITSHVSGFGPLWTCYRSLFKQIMK